MTSRSNRDQLFTSRTADQTNVQQSYNAGAAPVNIPDAPSNANDNDPLQLEHMLGYAGEYRKTILALPGHENIYVKR